MAKPIQGTKQADLTLSGTEGNDTIQGKDGNDFITGGKGNDNIDGGNGIDTALYSGNFADYTIGIKGTGNDKITVTDNVGTDGSDQLKHVEFLQFADATYNVQTGAVDQWHYHVNATLDDSAQDPAQGPGNMYAGTGIPATAFGIAHNAGADAGIELGLAVHHRSGPTSAVTSTDNYNDGVLHYQVAAGADPAKATVAEWNFDWSVATGVDGQPTQLDDFKFKLLIDTDPSANANYLEFTMSSGGTSSANVTWTDQFGHTIKDDEGVANQVAQNSENIAFFANPGYAPTFGPGHFDVILEAHSLLDNHLLAANHMVVDVV